MHRAIGLLGALFAVWPISTPPASAAPTAALRARFLPIRGFPATGNGYRHGAAVRIDLTIEGSEWGGFPPPLTAIKLDLPRGVRIHAAAFPSCAVASIEGVPPATSACPRGSIAGPGGQARAIVARLGERLAEDATLEAFYAPEERIALLASAGSPVPFRALALGGYTTSPAATAFGPELIAALSPLGPPVGEAGVSFEALGFTLGSGIKHGGKPSYYVTLPREGRCPKGGFPFRAELTFAGHVRQRAVAHFRAPCPRPRKVA